MRQTAERAEERRSTLRARRLPTSERPVILRKPNESTAHATFNDLPHFAGGIVPGDGIFTAWSYRAGAGRAESFLLHPKPHSARTAHDWGVVTEVVQDGEALSRAIELAYSYLKVPEITRRNTRVHFTQPLKERIVREVGYGLSLEGASAADLVKSMQATAKAQ